MYLHLGEKTVIKTSDIIGIFDLDNTTVSKNTREYLSKAQKNGDVINVSYELPKAFIVCEERNQRKIYISQLSSQTLYRRIINNGRK